MKSKKSLRKAVTRKIIIYTVISVLLFTTIVLGVNYWEKNREAFLAPLGVGNASLAINYNGEKYKLKGNVETTLFIGLDEFDDSSNDSSRNDKQADILMLLITDKDSKTSKAIHINRDIMIESEILGVTGKKIGTKTQQIALYHTYGDGGRVSCRNTVKAVSTLLNNIKINNYMSVTMDGVEVLNDSVGGVTVEIQDDLTVIDSSFRKGATVNLMGDQALKFIRTGQGFEDSSNSARTERQRVYMNELYVKLISNINSDSDFSTDVSSKLVKHITTNYTLQQLQRRAKYLSEYKFEGIESINGKYIKGEQFMEYYPDNDLLMKLIIDNFYTLDN